MDKAGELVDVRLTALAHVGFIVAALHGGVGRLRRRVGLCNWPSKDTNAQSANQSGQVSSASHRILLINRDGRACGLASLKGIP